MSKLGLLLAVLPALAVVACDTTPTDAGVDAAPAAAATLDAATAAESFLAFAESGSRGTDVSWAPVVRYSIAGQQVADLSPEFASRRESWVRCPGGATSYAGRDCPVSALGTLWERHRHDEATVVGTEEPEEVGCADYRVPWEAAAVAWVRPEDADPACRDDFALAVALDDEGRITAVDLQLGETG